MEIARIVLGCLRPVRKRSTWFQSFHISTYLWLVFDQGCSEGRSSFVFWFKQVRNIQSIQTKIFWAWSYGHNFFQILLTLSIIWTVSASSSHVTMWPMRAIVFILCVSFVVSAWDSMTSVRDPLVRECLSQCVQCVSLFGKLKYNGRKCVFSCQLTLGRSSDEYCTNKIFHLIKSVN